MMASPASLQVAHLIGEQWHIADLLLYGGASLGLVLGIGLFVWGRAERRQIPDRVPADDEHRPGSLVLDPPRR